MAGIDTLLKGAAGSLAKDKVTSNFTPAQLELASFILNPQYYLAEKGINKVAEILGYGSDYQDLQSGAKDQKAYYKAVMRDAAGDILPGALGDFVRANPKATDENQAPAGNYISWDPKTESWVEQSSPNPAVVFTGDANKVADTMRDATWGTMTPGLGQYVGPLPEDNALFQNRAENLAYDIKSEPTSGAPEGLDLDHLRSMIYGPNYTSGPQDESSQSRLNADYDFQNDFGDYLSSTNTSTTANQPATNAAPSPTSEFLQTVMAAPPGVDASRDAIKEFERSISPSMDYGSIMDYGSPAGGSSGGGKGLELYDMAEYKRGGQIRKGKR